MKTMTVWVYINTSHGPGHPEHLKVFDSLESANAWFAEHDPEGVAFEYPVLLSQDGKIPDRPPVVRRT